MFSNKPHSFWLKVWDSYLAGGLEPFLFFHILGIITPTDFHIFQRGRSTTNHQPVIHPSGSQKNGARMLICSCVPGLLQMKLAADFKDTKDNSIGSCHHLLLSEKKIS